MSTLTNLFAALYHFLVNLYLRFRHRKVATFHFDQLTFQGHPDFGAMFALYPSDEYAEFMVVKTPDGEVTTFHYDDPQDLDSEFYLLQCEYSDWLVNGHSELTWEMMTSGPDQSTLR